MEVEAGSLKKAPEEASLKVAQGESRHPAWPATKGAVQCKKWESRHPPITNTIESWLNEQEDVVRRRESIASHTKEKFIVVSTLCFCLSCCLLLV